MVRGKQLTKRIGRRRFAIDGEVFCPRAGDVVSLDRCFFCGEGREIMPPLGESAGWVRCTHLPTTGD